ncbi:MAG: DUF5402 family protein [Methanosarcinales archaeon]|nr:DUF5402 family protein [Methanosarcinales archaeon]
MTLDNILTTRASMEERIRQLIGRAAMIIELDLFALPCGCSGYTANTRGLALDDLEVFEEHFLKLLTESAEAVDVSPGFVFARIIPGTQEIAALNVRELCPRCYSDFAATSGKRPRPDIYIFHLSKRKRK